MSSTRRFLSESVSLMVVKSAMSEFMIVISRSSRRSVVAWLMPRSAWRMLRTTASGTNLAKASVPRWSFTKASWSSATSRMAQRCAKSWPYSGPSLEKSSSPRRRRSAARSASGRETRAPRLRPMPMLRTAMLRNVARVTTRALPTISRSRAGSRARWSQTCRLVRTPFAWKAPSGSAATMIHRVRASRRTVRAATRRQSRPTHRQCARQSWPTSLQTARLEAALPSRCAAAAPSQVPCAASRARAAAWTTSWEEFSALARVPSRASSGCSCEEATRLPCSCHPAASPTRLTMNMPELSGSSRAAAPPPPSRARPSRVPFQMARSLPPRKCRLMEAATTPRKQAYVAEREAFAPGQWVTGAVRDRPRPASPSSSWSSVQADARRRAGSAASLAWASYSLRRGGVPPMASGALHRPSAESSAHSECHDDPFRAHVEVFVEAQPPRASSDAQRMEKPELSPSACPRLTETPKARGRQSRPSRHRPCCVSSTNARWTSSLRRASGRPSQWS
mmetsp:Transcript_90432/g.195713  ORF Transcript_90432/g.195713 Transcript_90432/m.195713 type:complete len:508 (-) Transcript_90432:1035-2558(-)